MSDSDAPDWLVEIIANTSRLMSATPRSIADAVWWELQQKIALEIKESMDLRGKATIDGYGFSAESTYRLIDKETL